MEGLRKFGRNDIHDQTIHALWDIQEHTLGYLPNLSKILAASPEIYKAIFSIARMAFVAGTVPAHKKLLVRLSRSVVSADQNDIIRTISYCLKTGISEDKIDAIVNQTENFPFEEEEKNLINFGKSIFSSSSEELLHDFQELQTTLSSGQVVELVLAITIHDMVCDLNRICGTKLEDKLVELKRFFDTDFQSRQASGKGLRSRIKFADTSEPLIALPDFDSLTNQSQRGFWNLYIRKLGFMPNFLKLVLQWQDFLTQHMNITHTIIETGEVPQQVKMASSMIVAIATNDFNKQIRLFRLSKLQNFAPSKLEALYAYRSSGLFSKAEKVLFEFCEAYSSDQAFPDETDYTALRRYFTATQIVEIITGVCYYLYIQRVETILGRELEFDLEAFQKEYPMAKRVLRKRVEAS